MRLCESVSEVHSWREVRNVTLYVVVLSSLCVEHVTALWLKNRSDVESELALYNAQHHGDVVDIVAILCRIAERIYKRVCISGRQRTELTSISGNIVGILAVVLSFVCVSVCKLQVTALEDRLAVTNLTVISPLAVWCVIVLVSVINRIESHKVTKLEIVDLRVVVLLRLAV